MKYKTKKITVEPGCSTCEGCANNGQDSCTIFIQARVAEGLPDCVYNYVRNSENIIYVKDSKPKIKLELTSGHCVNCALGNIEDCLGAAEQLDLPSCSANTCYTVKVKGYK